MVGDELGYLAFYELGMTLASLPEQLILLAYGNRQCLCYKVAQIPVGDGMGCSAVMERWEPISCHSDKR
jgi:hypothetical protein